MARVLLIGDSIRMGYQQTVKDELRRVADVFWPEENGGNTRNVLAKLDGWLADSEPHVVHINCGLHDIRREFGESRHAVSLKEYRKNVQNILGRLQRDPSLRLVWAMTTPVNEEWHRANKSFDRFEADVVSVNEIAADLCESLGVEVNDLHAWVVGFGRDRILLKDGVHFTPEGYGLLGRRVSSVIKEQLSSMLV